jgi:hypothetical protein
VFWSETGGSDKEDSAKLADDINADFVAFGIIDAAVGALSGAPPICLRNTRKRVAPPTTNPQEKFRRRKLNPGGHRADCRIFTRK